MLFLAVDLVRLDASVNGQTGFKFFRRSLPLFNALWLGG